MYIGVDIGGTAIKVGICSLEANYCIRMKDQRSRVKERTLSFKILRIMPKIVEESPFKWDQVDGVGVGIAGFLDIPNGIVKFSAKFKSRKCQSEGDIWKKNWRRHVKVNNDANVAALGEAWAGAGRGISHCVCYTLGTGVGGGIIIDGKIVEGFKGMAGELGHMAIVPDLEAINAAAVKWDA